MFSALPVWISWDRCLLPCLLRLAKYLLSFPLDQLSVSCPDRSVHVRSLELTHFLWFYCSTYLNQTRVICCTAGICPMFIDLLVWMFVVFWRSVWSFYFLFRVIAVVHDRIFIFKFDTPQDEKRMLLHCIYPFYLQIFTMICSDIVLMWWLIQNMLIN